MSTTTEASPEMAGDPARRSAAWRRPGAVIGVFLAAVAIPFVITALRLRHPKPYVVLDLAQTELRVRAVFSTHPPLIGLPGRLGVFGVHTGSHPGPISFWVLAPFYKLFGSTSWALFAAALTVNFIWIALALWLAWRRGGLGGVVAVGTIVLVLVHNFGIIVVEQPWNPYLPLMAWTVVLLAAWSVLDDDIVIMPVLVVAATWCMQTHIPYLGLGGGLVATTVILTVLWRRYRASVDRRAESKGPSRLAWLFGDPTERPAAKRMWAWIGGSFVLGLVLWAPPIFDQFHSDEGNFTLIWDDMAHPPQAAGGIVQGFHLLFAHLAPWQLLTGHRIEFVVLNSNWPGAIFLAVWVLTFVVAWRFRMRKLVLANIVVTISLVFGLFALSKIYGDLYWYLMMWMWTICAVMCAGIVVVAVEAVRRAELTGPAARVVRAGASGLLTIVLVVLFASTTHQASRAQIPDRNLSDQMAVLVPKTVAAINAGKVPGDTGKGLYLVTWFDPVKIGSGGYTLLDELDAHGIPVGLTPAFLGIVPGRQTVPRDAARGVIHLSVGDADIEAWRAIPHVVEVAYYDGRTPEQKAEFARLRADARRRIAAAGGNPDVVDKSLTGASLNTSLPLAATQDMSKMAEIGLPMAVFLGPPSLA
ncbi:MAG: hypothetical protein JST73_04275 [Actinobacteria bacterium]|nr:hypothetical protein [Actinomycetota bacterium]